MHYMNWFRSKVVTYLWHAFQLPGFKKFLKLLFTVLIFYLIVRMVSYHDLKREILNAKLSFLVMALIASIGRTLLMAWRWQLLLNTKGYRYPLDTLLKLYFIGFFFNNLLPTAIGGDVARAVKLSGHKIAKRTAVSSILMERLLGLPALLLISSASYLICHNDIALQNNIMKMTGKFVFVAGLAGLPIFLIPTFFRNYFIRLHPSLNILQKLVTVLNEFADYWIKPFNLLVALTITTICQLCGVVSVYLVSLSIGQEIPFVYFSFLLPIIWLAIMLPISISGLGVREGLFLFLFGIVGMPGQSAIAISLLWLTFVYGQSLIGGFLFLTDRGHPSAEKSTGNKDTKTYDTMNRKNL